jgi:hypothetical protein
MGSISLPLVKDDISLGKAHELMTAAGRSGLVWEKSANEFRLYTAATVVFGLASGKSHLSGVKGDEVELPNVAAIASETPEPYIAHERLDGGLTSDVGLLAAGQSGDAIQATLFLKNSELLALLEPGPSDCYCQCGRPGPRGGTCAKDGNTIQCWPK